MKKLLMIALMLLFAVPCFGATLTWNASDRATGYIVYYNTYSKDVGNVTEVVDFDNVLSLVPEVEYTMYATAYNQYGESGPSNSITYTRAALPVYEPTDNPAALLIVTPPNTPVTIQIGQ